MTITAIIIDDEPLARARLNRLLCEQNIDVIAIGENGQQAIDLVAEHEADILFIDINMPLKSGLEATKEICAKMDAPPAIIFCTAYDQFAIEAFQTEAVAYLLKPIQAPDINAAIEKASSTNKFQRSHLLQNEHENKTIAVHYEGALQNLLVARFLYFKSENKNVFGVLDTGHELLIDDTLKNLEQQLVDDFIRTHRATLMNRKQAASLIRDNDGSTYVKLRDGDFSLPVSRRHLSEVKKCFQ